MPPQLERKVWYAAQLTLFGMVKENAKFRTHAVFAAALLLSLTDGVGTVGVPVNAGDARGAYVPTTKAVVAICVVFVPGAAVGAVGVPVNAGDANGASPLNMAFTRSNPVPISVNSLRNGAEVARDRITGIPLV